MVNNPENNPEKLIDVNKFFKDTTSLNKIEFLSITSCASYQVTQKPLEMGFAQKIAPGDTLLDFYVHCMKEHGEGPAEP